VTIRSRQLSTATRIPKLTQRRLILPRRPSWSPAPLKVSGARWHYPMSKIGGSYIAASARSDMTQLGKGIEVAATFANRPPPKFLALKLVLTDQQSVQEAVETGRREFGKLDIVINNAGGLSNWANVTESDPELWWQDLTFNLKGPFLMSRAIIPLLLEGEMKTLIFVASVGGLLSLQDSAHTKLPKQPRSSCVHSSIRSIRKRV
jgi:NADP-dependent 3-hydroxy acid dehydrogenase YdfG